MQPTIYMIRHGQTDWNAGKRLQGQFDVPMNDFGRSQVRGNARTLQRLIDDPSRFHYVASPLGRAVETIEIIREALGLPRSGYVTEQRLCELDYGEFSGHSWSELRRLRPADVEQRFSDSWNYVIPGGECYAGLAARVFEWFDAVREDTIVSAHAGVSRILQSRYLDLPVDRIAFLGAPQDRVMAIRGGQLEWL